ncbi:hypothetical protein WJX72_006375 [[Myrmecia] bisecta]|uniref:Uncharacterized protein n=1 Tax=[Myrmecia] bisecta TaxID=41462 RepID=A0AAW1P4V3_9CHLO
MPAVALPYGYKDARIALLVMAVAGEFAQGGLMFGWNAMALMLKDTGNFNRGCPPLTGTGSEVQCSTQESKLAVLWTIGIFALNFGPVLVGPVLDFVGPKLTTLLGIFLNILGLVLLAVSNSHAFNALHAGAVIMGLGGITYHLAQFHISNLFPRKRGLISSLFVAGFTGCGIVFFILQRIFEDLGSTRNAYRGTLLVYAGFCAIWIPLNFWMMPWHALQIGQMYVWTKSWRFKAVNRADVERKVSTINLAEKAASSAQKPSAPPENGAADGAASGIIMRDISPSHDPENGAEEGQAPDHGDHEAAFAYMGLRTPNMDSSDTRWLDQDEGRSSGLEMRAESPSRLRARSTGNTPRAGAAAPAVADLSPNTPKSPDWSARQPTASGAAVRPDVESQPLDVIWGPLVFEARRFVELRKKTFWQQLKSMESFGMGLFYTMNVFCIQFYLGTTRLQLEHKGDLDHAYTDVANIIVSFGWLGIPFIGWCLDKKGYGITLGLINTLGVVSSLFQAMPSLGFQVVTLIVWCSQRFFLYSSYFAIFGALFGFQNFGKMLAVDNTFNGLVGLLQLPLTYWGLHGLNGNFTAINLLQALVLLPLFAFCWYMYKWEREDLVPIRPMEGEELPCNLVGPRQVRESKFVATLEKRLEGAPAA